MTEPIAKLRLSALSKAGSPSPLPSPSGRGSIISNVFDDPTHLELPQRGPWFSLSLRERAGVRGNRTREYKRRETFTVASTILCSLIVLVLTALAALSAPAAGLKIEVQLIWGTTNQVSPNAEHKAIGLELKKKLQDLPLKWTNYFEVKRMDVNVPPAGVARVPLSEKCRLEITDKGHSNIQVLLFGKGEQVVNRTQALPKGETLILGGNANGETKWFAVLSRLD